MRSRAAPLYVRNLANEPPPAPDPFAEVQLEKVLKEISFVRIQLDDIIMPLESPLLQRLAATHQLYGFQLEYSFPSLDVVSKALSATVRIPEKWMTATRIEFKHKRVVLLTMHQDQVEHWKRSRLTFHLQVQIKTQGKHTTRPLAKCTIPLYELVVAPYMICRDFDFLGADFEATALIRIDLGSRVKSLMSQLEALRGDRNLEHTFVVTDREIGRRTRSRSSSRCRAHSAQSSSRRRSDDEDVRRRPTSSLPSTSTPMLARSSTTRSTSSIGSDSVFAPTIPAPTPAPRAHQPTVLDEPQPVQPPVIRTVSNSFGASTVGNVVEELSVGGKYYMQLTVHEASGLPPVQDEDGRIIAPSSFISVLGREGDLRSPIIRRTRQPRWEFTARFAISAERKNLIVKVLHHGASGDVPLGFVQIALPVETARRAVFEMADVTSCSDRFTSDVPMVTMSIERIRNVHDEEEEEEENVFRRRSTSPLAPLRRVESPPILESSEAIGRRMKKCMDELDSMVRGIARDL